MDPAATTRIASSGAAEPTTGASPQPKLTSGTQPVINEPRSIDPNDLNVLYSMQQEGLLCDSIIRTEDEGAFPVHRAIMSLCSPYFRAVFTTSLYRWQHSPLADAASNTAANKVSEDLKPAPKVNAEFKTSTPSYGEPVIQRYDITIPGIKSDMMKYIIEFAYLRKVALTDSNVVEIIIAADQFNVVGLVEDCLYFLVSSIGPENCIGLRNFARFYFFKRLEETAQRYIMKNFQDVADRSSELMELPMDELTSILGSDYLNVRDEELVWETVIRWIDKEPSARKKGIYQLMKQIRLGLLDTQYFIERVKTHPYVTESEACRPLVIDTLKFLYELDTIFQKETEVETPELARPRIPHDIMFVIGGWSGGTPTSIIESYDTRADRWIRVPETDPAGPRAYHGCAVVNSDIYVIGGFDGMEYFNSCRCFNAVTKQWREISPMHNRRCYVSVAVLDNIIYSMGGYDGHHRQNTAEKYNHKTNQWSMIAPMTMQRSDANATTLAKRIYIVGGFNGQECMSSAEVYDPDTNQWTMIAQMRSRRSGVSCIAYHGCVYAVGGFNGVSRLRSAEKYDPVANQWTNIPEMYNFRSNFAIEVIDDMIFAVGGFNGVTTIYNVECYDDKTNMWYEATDMNLYRSALSACVISGLPNVEDYIHKHRDRLVEEKRQRLIAAHRQQNLDNQVGSGSSQQGSNRSSQGGAVNPPPALPGND